MLALIQVDADDLRLDRLLQFYMFEWTALLPRPIGIDARFYYPDLPAFADRERHGAHLFLDGELPIGFALVTADDTGTWHIEEFFVLPAMRRRGAGADAARQLLATRPGPWTWTVRPENASALAFWRRVFPAATLAAELGSDGITRTRMSVAAPG